MLIETTLYKTKETKNMVRYDAPGDELQQRHATVPNLYVKKTAFGANGVGFPDAIKVTIEV